MPIYDYLCADCGSTYDVFHKVREVIEDVVCPSCGSVNHKRLIGRPNVSVSAASSHTSSSTAPSGCSTEYGGCCGGSCGFN
jgi:putative FmdB family regulatory protein